MTSQKNLVTALVFESMKKNKLSRNEIIQRMGYSNLNKGMRRLDRFLDGNEIDPTFVKRLTEALNIDPKEMQSSINDDWLLKRQLAEDHDRKIFKPYLYIQTYATRPSSICMYAMTGGTHRHKMVDVPENIPTKSCLEQIETIRTLITEHFKSSEGIAPFFGKISGYLYCPNYDSSYEFTIGGETDEINRGHFYLPEASIRLK